MKEFRQAGKRGGVVAKPPFLFFSDVMKTVQSELDGAVHWVLKEENRHGSRPQGLQVVRDRR